MSLSISGMSVSELLTLKKELDERIDTIKQEIQTHHHPTFIQHVGLDILMSIPVVAAKTLGLDVIRKYPQDIVIPKMLGNESVVRGLDASNRPFIAIKVNLIDSQTGNKVAQVIEVIFKRYSLDSDGRNNAIYGNNYVTASSNKGDDEKTYKSGLHWSSRMTGKQFTKVGQLLKGETIQHESNKRYFMRKA